MTKPKSDILIEIHDDKLEKLANLYKKKASWAPNMVSFINTGIRWKNSEKFRHIIKFTSPKNTWEKDGTIIAIMQHECNCDIVVFTLADDCTNLYEGLMQTNLIDYCQRVLFYGVHEKHLPIVRKYFKDKKIKVSSTIQCYTYSLPPEDAKNFAIECPSFVYLKKLSPSDAKQVNVSWPHRFPGSESYLATFIEANGAYGLFLKSTNDLVSWVLRHAWGQLGMLQTEENHKKRGYGSLVAKAMSKEIAEEGHCPLAVIVVDNFVSIKMFEKMGFRNIGLCTFDIIE